MTTDPQIIVGAGIGFASLFIMIMDNRRKISMLNNWAFGRNDDGGADDRHNSLDEQIDHIEELIEAESRSRRRDHDDMLDEVLMNRLYQHDAIESIAEILDEEDDLQDVNIDPSDIKPDWAEDNQQSLEEARIRKNYKDNTR